MLPLMTDELPADAAALADTLTASLEELFDFADAKRRNVVRVEAGPETYPHLKSIHIDLSGAEVVVPPTRDSAPSRPVGKLKPGPYVKSFELVGKPIEYQSAGLDLELSAREVQFEFGHDRNTHPVLMIQSARDGRVDVHITREDLDRAVLKAASAAAGAYGVTIKDVRVNLAQQANRRDTVAADIEIIAKKMLSAVIRITGEAAIDQALNARLSNLKCAGEGMVGNLVCGFVQPQLDRIGAKPFALTALSLGEVKLRDLELRVDDQALNIHAKFGA